MRTLILLVASFLYFVPASQAQILAPIMQVLGSSAPFLACSTSQFGSCPSTAQSAISLTTLGTTDWAVFGASNGPGGGFCSGATSENMSGGSGISNWTTSASSVSGVSSGFPITFSWTNGTPTTSGSASSGCYMNTTSGYGFSFTCAAGTQSHTCFVFVNCYDDSAVELTAALSDSSAPEYTYPVTCGSGNNAYAFQFTYQARSASQTLNISWTLTSGAGASNLALNAAAFQ